MPRNIKDPFGARPGGNLIAAAMREVQRAQVAFDRSTKIHEQTERDLQQKMEALARLQEDGEQLTMAMASKPIMKPQLSASNAAPFQSQFAKYNNIRSAQRLQPMSVPIVQNAISTPTKKDIEAPGMLPIPGDPQPQIDPVTGETTWQMLDKAPNEEVFVTGHYKNYAEGKQWEYRLSPSVFKDGTKIYVGAEVMAPVHPGGHHGTKGIKGRMTHFIIDSIHTAQEYDDTHDTIGRDEHGGLINKPKS